MIPRKKLNDLTPGHLIHPGEILKDELDFRNISQSDFAGLLGIQRSQLNELIKGSRDFNAVISIKVAAALDMDESIWLNLMQNYEVDKAKINNREQLEQIENWKSLSKTLPMSYLKKQKITTGKVEEDIPRLKQILGPDLLHSTSEDLLLEASALYRKSLKRAVNPVYLEVWKKLVEHRAKDLKVEKFNSIDFSGLSNQLKAIFRKNESVLEKSVSALASYGIKLVHLPKPDHCAVEGVSLWQDDNPVIGLSLTYKRIDNYAFNLFHELGHVHLHLETNRKHSFVDFETQTRGYAEDPLEKEANKFAMDHLIDPHSWENFLLRVFKPIDDDFIQFAKEQNVHPAIVFGRYCMQMGSFKRRTRIERKLS